MPALTHFLGGTNLLEGSTDMSALMLVRQIARISLPDDKANVARLRSNRPELMSVEDYDLQQELLATVELDRLASDAQVLWSLVKAARIITGVEPNDIS